MPKVIRYGELNKKLPEKLKISPVAMIPHKSRSYHTILDLSFHILHRGAMMQLVNSATVKQSLSEAIIQQRQCVQRLIATLTDNYDDNTPFKFEKMDIKYGFWRLAVSDIDTWNLCYVLPKANKVKKLTTFR